MLSWDSSELRMEGLPKAEEKPEPNFSYLSSML